jgi:hypothetical protein
MTAPLPPERLAAIEAAASRGVRWAAGQIGEHGVRGCEDDLLAHYKAPFCLAHAGETDAARRAMRHVIARFHDRGDFHRDVAPRAPWTGGTYANGWLASGAGRLGLDALRDAALDRIERDVDPAIGAPPNLPPGANGAAPIYDGGTAARAIESLLDGGRVEPARRIGRFLKRLYERQSPDASHVTWCVDARDRLFSPENPAQRASWFMLEPGRTGQVYWFLGFALRVFARLHEADRDDGWLDVAARVRGWLERCDAERLACISNAKLGWGAARMVAVTGDPHWAETALAVADWLVREQAACGVWVRRPQYADDATQPLAVSMDTTVERTLYLREILAAVAPGRPVVGPCIGASAVEPSCRWQDPGSWTR